jgi:hypothetical protein
MKRIWTLLIVLMICLSLSGCIDKIPPEPVIKINNVYHYTACGKDQFPNYVVLDLSKHLGSATNAMILIGNLEVSKDYSKSLNTTIECYEKQGEKSND